MRAKSRKRRRAKRPPMFRYAKDTVAARRKTDAGRRTYPTFILMKAFTAFARIIVSHERQRRRQRQYNLAYRKLMARDRRSAAYKKWLKQWRAFYRSRRA